MISTAEELTEKIDIDLHWRRQELTELKAMIEEQKHPQRVRLLIRCAITMLYAHWEGFVKTCTAYYLEYVASHKLPYEQLQTNFIGLEINKKINKDFCENKKMSRCHDLAQFFCAQQDKPSQVPHKKTEIKLPSNAYPDALEDILVALGLNSEGFSSRFEFINKQLIEPRNRIAHGEKPTEEIKLKDNTKDCLTNYLELHDVVIKFIETYRSKIETAAVGRLFVRNTQNQEEVGLSL